MFESLHGKLMKPLYENVKLIIFTDKQKKYKKYHAFPCKTNSIYIYIYKMKNKEFRTLNFFRKILPRNLLDISKFCTIIFFFCLRL